MYQEHPSFTPPENKDTQIWRYMDLKKFESLLNNQSLYFARADTFPDIFEGSYTLQNVLDRTDQSEELTEHRRHFFSWVKANILVNCWHMNSHESDAMWKLYAKSNQGIAIQSTYNRLVESLTKDVDYNINIGVMKYIDYRSDRINQDMMFDAFLHKRLSFAHENELRGIVATNLPHPIGLHETTVEHGLHISVHLDKLIEKIYVAPACDDLTLKSLQKMVEATCLPFQIIRSSLDDEPLY